uniref:Alliinase C-terminal domain-containing protein n=1 Tax=Fagus sylvatica TaxID=28930 RepID=A0A2N9IR09_FAGSY
MGGARLDKTFSVNGTRTTTLSSDSVLALSTGDPTLYEPFWQKMGDKCKVEIDSVALMSYFSDMKNVCWFLEPELGDSIKRLHHVVGNAVTDDRHIVVGTGSTQLFQAALYALTTPAGPEPVSIVSSAPYYSSYPEVVQILRSGLYKWAGDAYAFDKDEPYIEVVNTPNNPDGTTREAVVKNGNGKGKLIYDFAYYWPQYTAITSAADHDIMLFTLSKCTGHAGSRIGWALVKDKNIAQKMIEYITISSIGISKESQIRAAKIIGVLCDGCQNVGSKESENFFEFSRNLMVKRWQKLSEALQHSKCFTVSKHPREHCLFTGEFTETQPGFAWLKCKEDIEDCFEFLKGLKIIGRGGKFFGVDPKFARVSLMSREEEFNQFIERILSIKGISNGH